MRIGIGNRRATLPDAVRIELIKSLLTSLPQAASISITTTIGAVVLALRSRSMIDADFAALLALLGTYRVGVLLACRPCLIAGLTLASARGWQRRHAFGLLAQASALGAMSLRAFTSGDTAAALLTLGFVMAFCGGACARLSVVPWIPITTSLLLLVPTIVGAVMHSELPVMVAGAFLIAFVAAMAEATLYLHRLVVDRLLALQEASHRASHDGLTGLPNRSQFHQHLAQACRQAETAGRVFAVLYLDLDGFKAINDRLGHAAGDDVLIVVAHRIRSLIGPGDLVCRLGGDEFAILMVSDCGTTALSDLADRIAGAISQPVVTCAGPAEINVSIGIAPSAAHPQSSHDVLTAADQAMYAAKRDASTPWRLATSREPRIYAA